jgi:hypothetical protein
MAERRSVSRDWLGRAKRAVPSPLKAALKPIVAPLLPVVVDPRRPWALADRRTDNPWTIDAAGRVHRFFFITGCYKSGTNWVMNLLNLHPDVVVKGEFHFEVLYKGVTPLTEVPWYLSSRSPAREVAIESAHDTVRRMMYASTRDKPEATWIGDRTPRALSEVLPGAPTIDIVRDGRDVMVSWNFHHLRVPDTSRFLNQFRPLGESLCPAFRADPSSFERRGTGFLADEAWFRHHARVWADTVRQTLAEAPRFAQRGTPLLPLRYERMHEDLPGYARRLYEFLGLDPALAAPPSRDTRTLPGFENSSPTQFYRKGATGEWRDYFDESATRWFKEEAGDALIAAGYEGGDAW